MRQRHGGSAKVLISDGEECIEKLCGKGTKRQRCLVHGRSGLAFALYQDGKKKADRAEIEGAYVKIETLRKCQEEVNRLKGAKREEIQRVLLRSEKAMERLSLNTRRYVLKLVEDGLTYLRRLLEGGKSMLVSINRLENIWSQIVLRIKRIGKRWTEQGLLRMFKVCLLYVLYSEKFEALERTIRGEHLPTVSILITSLRTEWVADNVPPVL